MNNAGKDQTQEITLRLSVKYIKMLDAIAERTGQNRASVATNLLIQEIERNHKNLICSLIFQSLREDRAIKYQNH